MTEATVGEATVVPFGGKLAVHFTIDFLSPKGREFVAEKFYVYTEDRTVIFSFQTERQGRAPTAEARRVLAEGLEIR